MINRFTFLIALVFAFCAQSALAKDYIVKVKEGRALSKTAASIATVKGVSVQDRADVGGLIKVAIKGEDPRLLAAKIAELSSRADVEYIVENFQFHALGQLNDPMIAKQWALDKINAFGAWEKAEGSRDVVVAVIDTGIDYQHEDLKDNIWANAAEVPGNKKDDDKNGFVDDIRGWNFRDNNNDPMDITGAQNPGHGTHCAGIVGATGNNNIGISGISPTVSIMPLRFLGADGSGDLMASIKAIDYAIQNGATVISASWGAAVSAATARPIIEAIDRANKKGVLFVAAASNDGTSNDSASMYPANTALPNVISVAASDVNDAKPSWSNYGKYSVDLASPGLNILSSLPKNKYGNLSGTSMATPLVAGLAALLKSQDFGITPAQIKSVLQTTGAKVNIETSCGCRIDAEKAVTEVQDKALTVVPATSILAPTATQQFGAYGGQAPYNYRVSNADIATIDDQGKLTAKIEGDIIVTVEDGAGNKADSLMVHIAKKTEPVAGACPYKDPQICDLLCAIKPDLPWCAGK